MSSDRGSEAESQAAFENQFSEQDLEQLNAIGLSAEAASAQLERLARGTQYLDLVRPATLGDGIEGLTNDHAPRREKAFARALPRTTRFVPASGAASRMFADLLQQLDRAAGAAGGTAADESSAARDTRFFDHPWPFQNRLSAVERDASNTSDADRLRHLLHGTGADLAQSAEQAGLAHLPKALIPFHRDQEREITALEEQIEEAVELAARAGARSVRLHFTVSPEHRQWISGLGEQVQHRSSAAAEIELQTSTQSPSTDTLALDALGQPLRRQDVDDGRLVLRPGGHGALLHNLQESAADLVLIKNIDNVQPRSKRATTLQWKAALLGTLVMVQDDVFDAIESLDRPTDATLDHCVALLERFGRVPRSQDARTLRRELERPIRLCGVVPNAGEPGGGPFWVRDSNGQLSLQIVEGAQIDPDSDQQQAVLASSTHFNPVDLACGLRDRLGNPFDLDQFRDDDTYFVAHKSHDGQPIRALEHPGLWNGAMAHWLTLFVEAPAATFTPVKTVWDLLRPEHQP